jgi:hypothetical protein
MNLPPDRPGDAIDAHLRAALCHAPDQHERAPPLISARILAAARQAAPPARARPGWLPRWLAAPWAGAGSLAALLLVSGVLWLQRDALPPAVAPSEVPSEAAASAQAAPATKAAEAPVSTSAGPPEAAPAHARRAAPPVASADVGEQARVHAAPEPALAAAAAAESPPATAGVMAPAPPAPAMPERLASPAPAAEPEPAGPRSWRPGVADEAAARSKQRLQERRAMAAPAPAATSLDSSLARALAGAAPAAATPIAADSANAWSAPTPDAVPRPLPAGWLQALADATPVWTEISPPGAALADARAVSLWREGEAVVWLQLGRDRVRWCSAATGCWEAVISAESLSALSAALAP